MKPEVLAKPRRLPSIVLFTILVMTATATADVTLRLMTWVGYAPDAQVEQFEQTMTAKYKQPVKVKVHYINGYDEAFQLVRRGETDVIVLVSHILNDARFRFIENELISPLDLKQLPNYNALREEFKTHIVADEQVFAAPIASGPYGLAYNRKHFSKPPTSWQVLWDPANAGKYAITDGIFEVNLYVTALAMGYSPDSFGDFAKLNNPAFKAKLRGLIKNSESFWPGIDEAHHLQGLHLSTSWGFSIPALQELGEDWAMAEPKEGSPAWIDVHTIRNSIDKATTLFDVAHEWINYTLSADFQFEVIAKGIATPPVTTTAVDRLSAEDRKAFHLDDPEFLRKHRIYYPTITTERNRNGLKLLWQQANKGIEKPVRSASTAEPSRP